MVDLAEMVEGVAVIERLIELSVADKQEDSIKNDPNVNWVIFAVTQWLSIKILACDYNNAAFQEFSDEYISEEENSALPYELSHLAGKVFKSVWDNDFSKDYFGEVSGGFFISLDEKHLKELYDFNQK